MRGLKYLFTVPQGEKVLEKHLRRVLVSSVCSILLCMACLVSTTWAWFQVGVTNSNNVIQVGTFVPSITVQPLVDGNNGKYSLGIGTYKFILSAADSTASGYCLIDLDGTTYETVQIYPAGSTAADGSDLPDSVTFTVTVTAASAGVAPMAETGEEESPASQIQPVTLVIQPVWGELTAGTEEERIGHPSFQEVVAVIDLPEEETQPTQPTEETRVTEPAPTEPSAPPTEGTEPSTPLTEGTEPSTPPTEATEPSTPPTEATEPSTPPTEATEPSTPPTEETTPSETTETTEATVVTENTTPTAE